MFHPVEQTQRILAEHSILRSGKAAEVSLCQYRNVSCVRCCLPHIGGDSHVEDSGEKRAGLPNKSRFACHLQYPGRYLGPGGLVMRFKNFNPLKDPKIDASQYEDSFPDVGKEEMERRFSDRRRLFLEIFDPGQPRRSLSRYMHAAQESEGYKFRHGASAGPVTSFLGGSVPKRLQKGELPECQLLGFVDGRVKVGCLAHPLAKTSRGYDGRDLVGFFHHTGCCRNVGCEASEEFKFLSPSALKVFDKAVDGMSWYDYSRHAVSVFVYYLRSFDHLLQKLDERRLLEALTLPRLVEFTNALCDAWPLKKPDWKEHPSSPASNSMDSMDMLLTGIPLAEKILYIALDSRFPRDRFASHLRQARDHVEGCIEAFARGAA